MALNASHALGHHITPRRHQCSSSRPGLRSHLRKTDSSTLIKMRYVAAYMLAALGAKANPTAADIDKILSSVGIESDPARVSQICKELEGKNLTELMEEGKKKLASMPMGGGAPAAAAAAPAGAAPEAKKEAKKEEKPESESEDEDMGFGLFD